MHTLHCTAHHPPYWWCASSIQMVWHICTEYPQLYWWYASCLLDTLHRSAGSLHRVRFRRQNFVFKLQLKGVLSIIQRKWKWYCWKGYLVNGESHLTRLVKTRTFKYAVEKYFVYSICRNYLDSSCGQFPALEDVVPTFVTLSQSQMIS